MPELPTWLTAVISSAIAAAISYSATRRLYLASVAEKDASTSKIYGEVAAEAVKQLKEVRSEIPGWMQKLAAETARADIAEAKNAHAIEIQKQAKVIIENIKRLDFVPTGPITEHDMAAIQRLKEMRDAAKKIAECEIADGGN